MMPRCGSRQPQRDERNQKPAVIAREAHKPARAERKADVTFLARSWKRRRARNATAKPARKTVSVIGMADKIENIWVEREAAKHDESADAL